MTRAEGVDEALVAQQPSEGLALLVGEAGVASVRLGVGEVDRLVRAVEVAADDDGLGPGQAREMRAEIGVPPQAVVEARQLALRVGHVRVDEVEALELGREHATLPGMVAREVRLDAQGRDAGEDGRAGVALLVRLVPGGMGEAEVDRAGLGGLALRLLQAEDVRGRGGEEIDEPLAMRGAHAVDIPGDEQGHAGKA